MFMIVSECTCHPGEYLTLIMPSSLYRTKSSKGFSCFYSCNTTSKTWSGITYIIGCWNIWNIVIVNRDANVLSVSRPFLFFSSRLRYPNVVTSILAGLYIRVLIASNLVYLLVLIPDEISRIWDQIKLLSFRTLDNTRFHRI